MTLCSCSTLLCLRLCSSAVGAKSGSLVRNTAVPGTICGGFFSRLCSSVSSGTSVGASCCDKNARAAPPGQDQQHHRGAEQQRHPGAFEQLEQVGREERDVDEDERHDQQRACQNCQFHSFQITMNASRPSTTIVVATAMP